MSTRFLFYQPESCNVIMLLLFIMMITSSCNSTPQLTTNKDVQNTLLIQSPGGVQCKMDIPSKIPGALVLTKSPAAYKSSEINKITAYVNAAFTASPVPVPGDFQVLVAGSLGAIGLCQETIEITNNGNTSVQITNVNLKLLADPQLNTSKYKLVDICSLKVFISPCPPQGQGGTPQDFQYHAALDSAKANTLLHTQLYRNEKPSNTGPTLDSGDSVDVLIAFDATKVHASYQYSAFPVIALNSVGKQYTLPVRQLQSTFTLFNSQSLACYSSNGATFVPSSTKNSWCL